MARGRRGGRSAPDNDILMDTFFTSIAVMPQGVMGNQMVFYGSEAAFIARVNTMTPQEFDKITQANINIFGRKTKSSSSIAATCFIIWAAILILPLFCLCCQWFKKLSEPGFRVDSKVYEVVERLLVNARNLNVVSLAVYDNQFGKEKYSQLQRMLSMTRLKGFTLINRALPFGMNGDQYSDFQENGQQMRNRISQNGVKFQATWYTTTVL